MDGVCDDARDEAMTRGRRCDRQGGCREGAQRTAEEHTNVEVAGAAESWSRQETPDKGGDVAT